MNCKECQRVLEEYLDGELSPKEAETVGEHLSACSECVVKWHQLRSELEMFQSNHHPDVEFTERLWAGVQARLELHAPTRKSSDGWLAKFFSAPRVTVPVTVGLVLSAVVATALVMNLLSEAPGARSVSQNANNVELAKRPESSPLNALQPSLIEPAHKFAQSEEAKPLKRRAAKLSGGVPSMDRKSPEQLVREAEKKYLSAIGILSRDIGRRQSQLDQETRTRFEHALASIDRTIGATRKAVREHPTDPIAVQYMLSAYARKVDLLREIARSGAF